MCVSGIILVMEVAFSSGILVEEVYVSTGETSLDRAVGEVGVEVEVEMVELGNDSLGSTDDGTGRVDDNSVPLQLP